MKTIVIYESQTGFTRQYAEWIAEELTCTSRSLKEVRAAELSAYDRIIFGGWIMGGRIAGYRRVKKIGSLAAVFAVGASLTDEETVKNIQTVNQLGSIPFYYMQGGIHFDSLGFFKQNLLKGIQRSLIKKENRTAQEEFMAEYLGTDFDFSSKEQITGIIKDISKGINI